MRSKVWFAQISEKMERLTCLPFGPHSPVYCGRLSQDTKLLATSLPLGMAKKVPALLQTSLWESKAQVPVPEVRIGRVREFVLKGLST